MPDREEIFSIATANRLLIADMLERLEPRQWESPTLCEGWTVREVAGHLLQPMLVGFGRFVWTALRYRGDTDRTVDHFARRLARRSPAELVALLREHAEDRIDPPRVGPMGQLADTCIHLRDIARPLDLGVDVPLAHWLMLLDYLTGPDVVDALVPPHRLDGLALQATDASWAFGEGAQVTGPAEALAMAVTGRSAALADLTGPGVDVLAQRLH